MKTKILIILLIVSMLLFGCTQTQDQINVDNNNQIPTDTNLNQENQIVEQELNEGWINENEVIDTGSVI